MKGKMTKAPEPKDKLDATAVAVANGPEDAILDWDAVDWRACEESVRRLRQRIFTASRAGDLARVRSLQKLMLCSRANALLSVRRVSERNAGRLTAGIDGEVALTSKAKANLVARMQRKTEPFVALPGFVCWLLSTAVVCRVSARMAWRLAADAVGLLLGVVEAMVTGYVSSNLRDAVAFALLLAVLFFRPQGLFGSKRFVW